MPVTRWSRVLAAAGADTDQAAAAMGEIYLAYWRPLYGFLRGQGQDHHDAQDLINGLFAELTDPNGHWFGQIDRQKGRFRSFLLNALKFHLSNEHRRQASLKRGGAHRRISIDEEIEGQVLANNLADVTAPEVVYDRAWRVEVTRRVLQRLEREQERAGRTDLFRSLVGHLLDGGIRVSYRELGRPLGLSEGAVATALSRLRDRFRLLLRAEVAETLSDPAEVEDELRVLFGATVSKPTPLPVADTAPSVPPSPGGKKGPGDARIRLLPALRREHSVARRIRALPALHGRVGRPRPDGRGRLRR